MSPTSPTALVVHGGAWAIPDDVVDQHRSGVLAGLEQGWACLCDGGSAVDAAVRVLEDDPTFDPETSEHVLLVGAGADRYAREQGVELVAEEDLLVGRREGQEPFASA